LIRDEKKKNKRASKDSNMGSKPGVSDFESKGRMDRFV